MGIISLACYIFLAVLAIKGLSRIAKLGVTCLNSFFDKIENKLKK